MSFILAHVGDNEDRCLHIGLVNNMPDSALERTELQYSNLFVNAAPAIRLRWSYFSLGGIVRGSVGQRHFEHKSYRDLTALSRVQPDALIVTGTEPGGLRLEHEPYWAALTELFDWLNRESRPALFSCLAAHAAVFYFDRIRRRSLTSKLSGIFNEIKVDRHELTDGLEAVSPVAHSRCNELPCVELEQCGYRVLTEARDAGAGLFVKEGMENWLFFQGHPEYDHGALGREYRRDVRKFLTRQREIYPGLPAAYYTKAENESLIRFKARAIAHRDESIMEEFPAEACSHASTGGGKPQTGEIFRVWLNRIAAVKAAKLARTAARRGGGTDVIPNLRRHAAHVPQMLWTSKG